MILYRHIVREHVLPFCYAFSVILFFLIMNLAVQLLDKIISKGLDPRVVIELFIIQLGWIIALAVPMATLVASLTTFGRMAADNEILAVKASGQNVFQLITPVMLSATILAVLLVFFNNNILPEANHRAANLTRDISRKRPAAFIDPGVLIRDFENYVLYVQKVNSISGRLDHIVIFANVPGEDGSTTVADSGYIATTPDGSYLQMTLYNGETHTISREKPMEHGIGRFGKQVIFIQNVDSELHRSENSYRGDREKSSEEMLKDIRQFDDERKTFLQEHQIAIDTLQAQLGRLALQDSIRNGSVTTPPSDSARGFSSWVKRHGLEYQQLFSEIRKQEHNTARLARRVDAQDRKIAEYWVEVHKKYSIPATVLVFVLIGAPLGMMARNGGMAVGVSYSIFFFIVFWAFLIGGEHLANKMIISPWLAMWSGPITVGLCGVYLSIQMIREASVFSFAPVVHFFKSIFRRQPGRAKGRFGVVVGSVVRFVFDIPFLLTRILARRIPTYLIKQFFGWLVGMLIAMALVFVIVDYISNLRRFENATFKMVLLYYWFYLPWILQTVLPIVVLLATMFGMGSMAKNSELTAMRGAGINVFQLAVPMFVIGILIAGANFYVGERIIPNANLYRKNIKEDISRGTLGDYQRREAITPVFRHDFYYFGNANTIYGFGEFRTRPQQSRAVWRETISQNRIVQRLEAESMVYDDSSGSWSFTQGIIRSFKGDSCRVERFENLADTILRATPDEMVVRVKGVEEMSYWELRDYIDKVKRRGENASIYSAELYFKIALPMMSFIVILLGISIAAQMRKKGGAVLFGIGLFVVFAYWILSRFALAFAQNGQLPPMVGAWVGNALFLMIGIILFRKAIR